MGQKRRRAPLTLTKRRKGSTKVRKVEADLFRDEDSVPEDPKPSSWDEWAEMQPAAYFKLRGYTFRKGDSAVVFSSGDEDNNVWIAHIRSIRSRQGANSPWVLVHWYYSMKDLEAEYGHALNLANVRLSANERICSDRQDLLSYRVFQRVVDVVEWDERDIDTPRIARDCFFTRSRFSWSVPKWVIAPAESTCAAFCDRPYDPFLPQDLFNCGQYVLRDFYANRTGENPPSIMLDADIMHFCSRPSCRRWYHRACLVHNDLYVEPPNKYIPGSRDIRRIAVDPCKEAQDVNPKLHRYTFPQNATGKMSSADLRAVDVFDLLERDLGTRLRLPRSVVRVAARPVMRRADLPWPRSAVGYMEEILLAQNLVHQELEFSREELDAHIEAVDVYYGARWAEEQRVREYMLQLLADSRILASPLRRYWDRLERELAEVFGSDAGPALACLNCGAPI